MSTPQKTVKLALNHSELLRAVAGCLPYETESCSARKEQRMSYVELHYRMRIESDDSRLGIESLKLNHAGTESAMDACG
jgi:hypothetical protein